MIYGARPGRAHASHNRQVVGIICGLLAFNGLLWWVNTLHHKSLLLVPLTHIGNYGLLGLWLGVVAISRNSVRTGSCVVAGAAIVASQVHIFLVRPELTSFGAGWAFWLTSAAGIVAFGMVVVEQFRNLTPDAASQSAEQPLATVVPITSSRVRASAKAHRAA